MQASFFGLAALALGLGIKHSFDVDHVVAVGNLLTRARSMGRAVRLSLWWSLGHMATAGALTVALLLGRDSFLPGLVARVDLLVPLMLVAIGLLGFLWAGRRLHAHTHLHGPSEHAHLHVHVTDAHDARKMGGIGLVHGLASNDELLVLFATVLGANNIPEGLAMVAIFSAGVVLGMAAYAATLHYGFSETRRPAAAWWANVVFSGLSIVYAAYLLAGGAAMNAASMTP